MVKKLALVMFCFAYLGGNAMAQDAKTVIANAKKALGDPTSITYSGSAKDVAFQQCGANATAMNCQGTHDPMRPISNYVRVIDLAAPASRHTGGTQNIGAGGSTTVTPGTFFQQVTPQQADVSQPWGQSLELYITPWGFLKGAEANNATAKKDGKYTVLTWSPTVKAPSGKSYTINGYVNDRNQIERVETWLGENIMGDMHILATYSGWKDFGGAMAPSKIVQTRGGLPFFEVDVTSAKANPPDVATLAAAPAPAAGRGGPGGGAPGGGAGRGGAPPALVVTNEKLGEGVYRLTTGPGSYDSILIEFRDHLMLLEAGQSEARGLAYIAEAKKMVPEQANPLCHEHAPALRSHRRAAGAGGRRRDDHHAEEQRGLLREGAQHAADAARRHAGEEPEEGQGRSRGRQEGLLGWDADRRDVPHLSGASLERPDGRVPPEGAGALPGRLLAARARAAGQRSRQGPGAGAREAQARRTGIATSTCTPPRRPRPRTNSGRRLGSKLKGSDL